MTTAKQSDDPHTAPLGGAPREAEPQQVDVPRYPSGTVRYRHDGHGWVVSERWANEDAFLFSGSLVSHACDPTWLFARFAEALRQLAAATARVREVEAERDAWRAYAEHVEGCRECGEMSWQTCYEGTAFRLAAFGSKHDTDARAWDDAANNICDQCGRRLGEHRAWDFSCPQPRAAQRQEEPRE